MKHRIDAVRFYDVVLQWTKCSKAKHQRLGQFVMNELWPYDASCSEVFYAETVNDFWTVVFEYIELTHNETGPARL